MKTNKKYMVVQISCKECGITLYPLGVFNTLEEAREVKENHPSTGNTEGGDGYVKIWFINKDNTVGIVE